MPVVVGDVILEKYRVEGILGSGGMGMVLAARHIELDERVAIKQLLPHLANDPALVARFLREGKNAAKIRSEHVGRVFDVARLADGAPILVMEHLEGTDLARLLKISRTIAMDDALEIFLQTCEAAASAHAVGIVHRDLKPANIFLTQRLDGSRCVKVLDFGISKAIGAGAELALEAALTSTAAVVGSPVYMSPEQMISPRDVDTRSDIWSLGVILYRMLAGRLPFPAENALELAAKVASMAATPLRDVRPEVPEPIEALVMQCLQRDRARRFQDLGEVAKVVASHDARWRPLAERIERIAKQRPAGTPSTWKPSMALPPVLPDETRITSAVTLPRDSMSASPSLRHVSSIASALEAEELEPRAPAGANDTTALRSSRTNALPLVLAAVSASTLVALLMLLTSRSTPSAEPAMSAPPPIVAPSVTTSPTATVAPSTSASASVAPGESPKPELPAAPVNAKSIVAKPKASSAGVVKSDAKPKPATNDWGDRW